MVKQEKQQFLRPGTKFFWVFLHRTVDNTRIYNLKKGRKEGKEGKEKRKGKRKRKKKIISSH